jgi:hypothetical protein
MKRQKSIGSPMLFSFGTILAISKALNKENIDCHEKNSLNRSDGPNDLSG